MEKNNRVNEVRSKILSYQRRGEEFLENTKGLAKKGELAKAGEFLWGAIASYINALTFLHTGMADDRHGEMVEHGKEIANQIGDQRLFKAIDKIGSQLHANFYHGFITIDSFPDFYQEALYAVEVMDRLLKDELSKLGVV